MRGNVLDFSVQTGTGIISAEDGARYEFAGREWRDGSVPARGLFVDFEAQGGTAVAIYRALSQSVSYAGESNKSKSTAAILAILIGGLGIHKFYLGQWGLGIVYLVFCWAYIPAILGVIEGIRYLTLTDDDFDRKAATQKVPFGFIW